MWLINYYVVLIQVASEPHAYSCLFDADHGENGTLYIEGNRTLISLNLSRKKWSKFFNFY